jgi:RHS repeat-associated protein
VHYWENTATTSYYPYGEEETPTANDRQKFATYTRDSATGLDYAQNRYYASQIGRFTTADPYRASAKRRNPQSWNRYAYVQGDPINANDPTGLCAISGNNLTIGDLANCDDYNPYDSTMAIQGAAASSAPEDPTANTDSTLNSTAAPGQPTVPVDSSSAPGSPSDTVIAPVVPVEPVEAPVNGSINTIVSFSGTSATPGAVVGGLIGLGVGGLPGALAGLVAGSTIGVGGNISWVPGTNTWYVGPVMTFTPMLEGGDGWSASVVFVPGYLDPNSVANGSSSSVALQPAPWAGFTSVISSSSPDPVNGFQVGSKSPVTFGSGYNQCLWNCHP